jgi:hypothetical protein
MEDERVLEEHGGDILGVLDEPLGPRTEPWDRPNRIVFISDSSLPTRTTWLRPLRKSAYQSSAIPCIPKRFVQNVE